MKAGLRNARAKGKKLGPHPHQHKPEAHTHASEQTPPGWFDRHFGRIGLYQAVRLLIVGLVHGLAGSPPSRCMRNAFDVPQQMVCLRADNNTRVHFWNIAEDFRTLFVDKGASKDVRIQFRDVSEHNQVAVFSSGEINRGIFRQGLRKRLQIIDPESS